MNSSLSAYEADALIRRASIYPTGLDDTTKALVLSLFTVIQPMAICGNDERRELWITAEHSPEGEPFTRTRWYKLAATVYEGLYSIFLDGTLTLQIMPEAQGLSETRTEDLSELARWLLASAEACISSIKSGTYTTCVNENLPFSKRLGKILRKDYWDIFPSEKDACLLTISPDEIQRFTGFIQAQPPNVPAKRLHEMTSGFFFDCCRLGYATNQYPGSDTLASKELYRTFADGRDDGLMKLEEASVEAFDFWYNDITMRSGYPWEVCKGTADAGISLYPAYDEYGWWFYLSGAGSIRSVETVKFYLALADRGIPVYLLYGRELADMLIGKDYIGIVPEGIRPQHCEHLFSDEKFLDYMNLPIEKAAAVAEKAYWYPPDEVRIEINPPNKAQENGRNSLSLPNDKGEKAQKTSRIETGYTTPKEMNSELSQREAPTSASIWTQSFIILFFTSMAFNTGLTMSNSLVSVYADSLGATAALIGLVTSTMSVSSLLLRFVSAPVIDTYNKKFLVMSAALMMGVAFWGYSIAHSVSTLVVFRLLQGCAMAFGNACCLTMVADLLPREKYNSGIGYFSLAQVACQAVGPSLGLELVDLVGFRGTYTITAVIMLIAAFLIFLLNYSFTKTRKLQINLHNSIANEALLPASILMILALGSMSVGSFLIVYARSKGITGNIGLYFTVSAITMLVSRPLVGKLTDKYGIVKVAVPALFCNIINFYILSRATSLTGLMLGAFVSAFGQGACNPILQGLSMKTVPPERRGAASCTNFIGIDLGSLLGPPIAGFVAQTFGYTMMFRIMGLPFIIGMFVLYFNRRRIIGIEESFMAGNNTP